jgi:hypothetical protein
MMQPTSLSIRNKKMQDKQPVRKTTGAKAIALDKKALVAQYRLILAGILTTAAALGVYELLLHFIH